MSSPRFSLLLGAAALWASSCSIAPGSGHPPAPQRPTVSVDTSTTAKGSGEMEVGVSLDPGDSMAVPVLFKYGASDTVEVFLGADVIRTWDGFGLSEQGFGDTIVGARARFMEEEGTSAGALVSAKIPTADDARGLGSGELDLFGAGILTRQVREDLSITGYAQLGLIGQPVGGDDLQMIFAVAPSLVIDEQYSLFAEFALTVNEGPSDPTQLMLGVTRLLEQGMVADAGIVLGINDEAPDFSLFIGLTANLGGLEADPEPAAEGSMRRSAALWGR